MRSNTFFIVGGAGFIGRHFMALREAMLAMLEDIRMGLE